MKNSYVYRHINLSTLEVFYVGIGRELNYKRAYRTRSRSQFWHNIVNKYGYEVQILKDNLDWEEACELEMLLISEYGRSDLGTGSLVNHTDGGDGISNPSLEVRAKMSKGRKGKESIWLGKTFPQETKDLMKTNHADFSGGKHPRARKVVDTRDGKIYDCVKDVADKFNLNHRTLCAKLNGVKRYKPDPYFKFS